MTSYTDKIEMPYRVLYRHNSDFFSNYQDGDELTPVFEGIIAVSPGNPNEALEVLFAKFNRGSPEEALDPIPQDHRSLSVGDVIVLGEVAFSCDRAGWSKVTLPREA